MKHRLKIRLFMVLTSANAALLPASAQTLPDRAEDRYSYCMDLAKQSPDRGIAYALEWQTQRAGVPGRHCEAIGLFHLGEYAEAAARLEGLVDDMRTGRHMPLDGGKPVVARATLLADMYNQAANAWLLAGKIGKAEETIDNALSLVKEGSPAQQLYLIDRARIAAHDRDYQLAYDDLLKVVSLNPERADVHLFLASAAREIGKYAEAQRSLDIYLKANAKDPTAYLEQGNLYHETGRHDAARQSWLKVLLLTDEGADADAARANLEKLDVRSE